MVENVLVVVEDNLDIAIGKNNEANITELEKVKSHTIKIQIKRQLEFISQLPFQLPKS